MDNNAVSITEYEPQTKEQNAQFAAKRRLEQAMPKKDMQDEDLPIEGLQDISLLQNSLQYEGLSHTEGMLNKDDIARELAAHHEALASDIRAICQKYPDETAQNVSELGMEYIGLCACGMPSIIAYENVRAKQKPVPFIGDVKGEYAAEKDFYTKAEVDGMSKQDIKKNYTKIRNSMEKW